MADILIVEDELSINELIRRNLGLAGHRCTQAFDGEEAIELLGEKTFDLVILDIMRTAMRSSIRHTGFRLFF